jgi:hypothetical protein
MGARAFKYMNMLPFTMFWLSAQASAQGFVGLPPEGFAVEGGTSAYTLCHTAGNFGGTPARKPSPGMNDRCAVFPANNAAVPLPGFRLVATDTHPIIMNNGLTSYRNRQLGHVRDFVWRNEAATECIFGLQVMTTLGDADYDEEKPGTQYLKISDVSRGGFAGLPVAAAYSAQPHAAQPVYRMGRTFTAVQYRAKGKAPAPGYVAQPLVAPHAELAISGIDSPELKTPAPHQQSAALDDNWVTFTTRITALNEKRESNAVSSTLYVKAPCSGEPPQKLPDAIRLRQTDTPFIELSIPGFVPAGAAAQMQPLSYQTYRLPQ